MGTAPIASIIIPTYNRAGLLPNAIRSVLRQTFQDFELIIVDDGSSDNTEEVVAMVHNHKIKYIRHESNKGGSAARNTGIMSAQGKYIGFLDDDDEWYSEKLQKQINKFRVLTDDFGLVYTGFSFTSMESGEVSHPVIPSLKGHLFSNLLKNNILGSPTPLIKKVCFEKAGYFDETLPSIQDWDMWIRISKFYYFDFVPEILAKHYIHGNQISANLSTKIKGREILVRKYHQDLSGYPLTYSNHLRQLGILHCLSKNGRKGRNYFLKSIRLNTLQKGVYFHLIFSFLAPELHRKFIKKYNVIPFMGISLYN